jgi:hypothetical protein
MSYTKNQIIDTCNAIDNLISDGKSLEEIIFKVQKTNGVSVKFIKERYDLIMTLAERNKNNNEQN